MTYKSSILQFLPKAIKNFNIICHVENWQINSICRMCIIAEKRVEVSDIRVFILVSIQILWCFMWLVECTPILQRGAKYQRNIALIYCAHLCKTDNKNTYLCTMDRHSMIYLSHLILGILIDFQIVYIKFRLMTIKMHNWNLKVLYYCFIKLNLHNMKNISKLQIKDTIILFFTDNVNLWRTFSKYKVLI